VGRNKLASVTQEICKSACIGGNRSNHSLRATGATELNQAGVPEKIIQQRTGHRSLEALRKYEHISDIQHNAVSNILAADKETSYSIQMTKVQSSTVQQANVSNQQRISTRAV
jgi:integrase